MRGFLASLALVETALLARCAATCLGGRDGAQAGGTEDLELTSDGHFASWGSVCRRGEVRFHCCFFFYIIIFSPSVYLLLLFLQGLGGFVGGGRISAKGGLSSIPSSLMIVQE